MKGFLLAALLSLFAISESAFAERFLPRGDKPNNVYGVGNFRQGMTGLRGNRQQFLGRRAQGRGFYGFRARYSTFTGVRRQRNFFGNLRFK